MSMCSFGLMICVCNFLALSFIMNTENVDTHAYCNIPYSMSYWAQRDLHEMEGPGSDSGASHATSSHRVLGLELGEDSVIL
jgi:hypothetical protein